MANLSRCEEGRIDWNRLMLKFGSWMGSESNLCQPYRTQTRDKTGSPVKYLGPA